MNRAALLPAAFVVIWSSGYVVGSIAANDAPALAITFWRILIAGALLAAAAGVRGTTWPRGAGAIGGIALVGVVTFGVQFGGIYLGLAQGMPAGTTSLLVSCCPLLVALAQAVLGSERLRGTQWFGGLLGLTGVVLALLDHLTGPASLGPLMWTLLGVAGFAAGTVLMPRLVPAGADPIAVASIECFAACVVLVGWALPAGGLAVPLTTGALGSGTWLTLVNGVGGPVVLLALVRTRGATRASSLLYVVPAVTALASWPILGQPITLGTVAGLVVAGVGVALVQRGRRDRVASASPPPRPAATA